MDDCDLRRHDDPAHDPRVAAEEIGDDDEFPVPRSEGMDASVSERDRHPQKEGAEIVAALERAHVQCDFRIRLALEFDRRPDEAGKPPAAFRVSGVRPRIRVCARLRSGERGRKRQCKGRHPQPHSNAGQHGPSVWRVLQPVKEDTGLRAIARYRAEPALQTLPAAAG